MDSVGIRELKQNASAVVARTARGESVTVTDRGRPVAALSPVPTSRLAGLVAAGLARPAVGDLGDLTPPSGPVTTALSRALTEDRSDRAYGVEVFAPR
ncbi:type II toxin-antitoxin system prevent-host-death family antitoxin [Klenkia sp. LSe6-5]|uniref:Antitoxin n=1 Tax=Klenkia sesuvii TaxID=3103137 RepID=A0ABU8DXJ4_9ACTN